MPQPKYKMIMLKLSGETLAGTEGFGISAQKAQDIAKRVKKVRDMDVQVGIVIGAGNLWRGRTGLEMGMDQATADYMGMLGTVMNALALMDALEKLDVDTRVQSAIEMRAVAEPYIRRRAIRHLEKGRVVIFGGGTGKLNCLECLDVNLQDTEIGADVLIKATKVDGMYDSDPNDNHHAKKFDKISYIEALNLRQSVMDSTAVSLCMENKLPILILNFWDESALLKAIKGESVGTLVSD